MKDGGYLLIDHRASPGLPEDIARASGYDPRQVGEGKMLETKTFTCSHCKCSVVPNPFRTRDRATCFKCGNHYICDICHFETTLPDYSHTPFDKKAELVLSSLGSPFKLLTEET